MCAFNKFLPAILSLFYLITACNTAPKADPARIAQARIDSMEKALVVGLDVAKKTPDAALNPDKEMETVLELIKQYQFFSADFKKDTAAPTYLMKEAQLFGNYLHDYAQSAKVYSHLVDSFPQAGNRPSALFFLASTQHDLADTAAAQATLRKLLAEYPGTGAAKMVPQFSEFVRNGLPQAPATETQPVQ